MNYDKKIEQDRRYAEYQIFYLNNLDIFVEETYQALFE